MMGEHHLVSQPCGATLVWIPNPQLAYTVHLIACFVSFLETSRNVKFDAMLLFLGCIYNIRYSL